MNELIKGLNNNSTMRNLDLGKNSKYYIGNNQIEFTQIDELNGEPLTLTSLNLSINYNIIHNK